MFELRNVDTKLLREQRSAVLDSVEEAERNRESWEDNLDPEHDETAKRISKLDGLVNMIDDILDAIELTRPIERAQHPLWEEI